MDKLQKALSDMVTEAEDKVIESIRGYDHLTQHEKWLVVHGVTYLADMLDYHGGHDKKTKEFES